MRFGHFISAIAIVIGAACAAGDANAATVLVQGSCVSVADTGGCFFTGTINDQYVAMDVAGHPNSYLNAMDVYNTFVTSNPGHGPTINLDALGETAGDPAGWSQPYPNTDLIVGTLCAGDPQFNLNGCDDIGTASFNSTLTAGSWTLTSGPGASFVAVDANNQFELYELGAPEMTDTWDTSDIPTNSGADPQLFRLVLFSSAVPEPATWAMFLMGFGAVGFMMRGSRRKSAAATA